MRKIFVYFLLMGAMVISSCEKKSPEEKKTKGVKSKTEFPKEVKDLLAKMSVEEKAGQMTQIDIRNLLNDGYGNTDQKINAEKLAEAIQKYHVGSLLNCIHAYTPEKWIELITQMQDEAMKTGNKIPILYGTDAVHGVGFISGATLFPHNIGLAATRNDELVKEASHITAIEARSVGFTWNFAPVLDVGREPYWARLEETFGEDVYLSKQMGNAAIIGMESPGLSSNQGVAACMKHFIGYSAPKNGIDRTQAHIPDIILREYFLPPFAEAVRNGVATVMINSAEINGIPTHGNKKLLTDLLRDELGFEGMACSDWEDIIRLHTWHKVAATPKEAVAMAVNAGVDMSMVPNDFSFPQYVVELVNEGKISKERLDEAVGRILTLKHKLGLFANPMPDTTHVKTIGSEKHQQVALEAARESIVLLENKNSLLPLKSNARILVAGPCANSVTALNSSWSYTWQGDVASHYPEEATTVVGSLQEKFGKGNVISNAVADFNAAANYDAAYIRKNAAGSDVIVLCLGEPAYAEQPGVIKDLNLPAEQKELVRAAKQTGKPVVLLLIEGRPRLLPEVADLADAVLLCFRPGNTGGTAIAEILSGDVNPSARMPFTYPRYNGDIILYDHKWKEIEQQLGPGVVDTLAFNPQWEFGRGLSYTTFEFSNLKADKKEFSKSESVKVDVTVKNTGERAGKVSVELYSRDHFASITPNVRRLRKYSKIELKPGESKEVSFTINAEDLSFVSEDNIRITEPGKFDLMVEGQKTVIELK